MNKQIKKSSKQILKLLKKNYNDNLTYYETVIYAKQLIIAKSLSLNIDGYREGAESLRDSAYSMWMFFRHLMEQKEYQKIFDYWNENYKILYEENQKLLRNEFEQLKLILEKYGAMPTAVEIAARKRRMSKKDLYNNTLLHSCIVLIVINIATSVIKFYLNPSNNETVDFWVVLCAIGALICIFIAHICRDLSVYKLPLIESLLRFLLMFLLAGHELIFNIDTGLFLSIVIYIIAENLYVKTAIYRIKKDCV